MDRSEIKARRDEIAVRTGAWTMHNIQLAPGVHTIGEGEIGDQARLRRAVQVLRDVTGGKLAGTRVLDLECGEGGRAIELGKQGAEVVALASGAVPFEKAEFAREALGLRNVTVVRDDARRLSAETYGYFDVVIAQDALDRLDAPALFRVAEAVGTVCKGVLLVETELATRSRTARDHGGVAYRGAVRRGGLTFHLTRASFLNLLTRVGFTSILEVQDPEIGADASCFAAFKGRRVALATAPLANASLPAAWPERPRAPGSATLVGILTRPRR